MNKEDREQVIERAGIVVANRIQNLEDKIDELHRYLKVARVAHVKGFNLTSDARYTEARMELRQEKS